MTADIFLLADKFRAALEAEERDAASRLLAHYGRAWRVLQIDLEVITDRIRQAIEDGEELSPSWLYRQDRYQTLIAKVEAEIGRVAQYAAGDTYALHLGAIEAAAQNMADLVAAAPGITGTFYETNLANAQQLIGHASDGSPLADLFRALPRDAGQRVEAALVTSLVAGRTPALTTAAVRNALGGNMARARTIARTEIHRAYRETSRRSFEANAHIVQGWVWTASISPRTCAACFAMHGTKHRNTEHLDGHPNCRCAMVPYTGTFEVETGEEVFERLSASEKYAVLGPQKMDRYERGELSLADLVGRREDRRWGSMRYERSVLEIERSGRGQQPYRLGTGLAR